MRLSLPNGILFTAVLGVLTPVLSLPIDMSLSSTEVSNSDQSSSPSRRLVPRASLRRAGKADKNMQKAATTYHQNREAYAYHMGKHKSKIAHATWQQAFERLPLAEQNNYGDAHELKEAQARAGITSPDDNQYLDPNTGVWWQLVEGQRQDFPYVADETLHDEDDQYDHDDDHSLEDNGGQLQLEYGDHSDHQQLEYGDHSDHQQLEYGDTSGDGNHDPNQGLVLYDAGSPQQSSIQRNEHYVQDPSDFHGYYEHDGYTYPIEAGYYTAGDGRNYPYAGWSEGTDGLFYKNQ